MPVCKRVFFSGSVQGVGFRWTTMRVTKGFAVTGYVKNLSDGRVEVVAEGEPAEVERFLAAVEQKMAGYVTERESRDEPPHGFIEFSIEH